MSDIVERLRNYAIGWEKVGVSDQNNAMRDVLDAANEIAQLRIERDDARREIERLRDVIAEIEHLAWRVNHGPVRDERHARGADADTERASGDHPAVA